MRLNHDIDKFFTYDTFKLMNTLIKVIRLLKYPNFFPLKKMQARKTKELTFSSQQRKPKEASILKKPIQRVLKAYNSCFHQKKFTKKDFAFGNTVFTVSINIKDYPKTLQAYRSLDSLEKFDKSFVKNKEIADLGNSKAKKIKCEGFCGKIYNRTYLENFAEDGQNKILCPDCIEKIMSRMT